jgi:moderate conductance mechanosensitive channel
VTAGSTTSFGTETFDRMSRSAMSTFAAGLRAALLCLLLFGSAAVAATPAGSRGDMPGFGNDESMLRDGYHATRSLLDAAQGIPELGASAVALHRSLVEAGAGRPVLLSPELLALYAVLMALLAEKLTLLALGRRRRRIAEQPPGMQHGLRLVGTDVLGVLAFAIVAMVFVHRWFPGAAIEARFGHTVLDAALMWRIMMLPVEIMLRPHLAGARHAPIDDQYARRAKLVCSALLLPAELALNAARHLSGIAEILCVTIAAVLFAFVLLRLRRVVAFLILGRYQTDPQAAGLVRGLLARRWYAIALAVLLALYVAYLVAETLGDLAYYVVLVRTIEIGIALWSIEALCTRGLGQLRRHAAEHDEELIAAVIGVRIVRALARTVALTVLALLWLFRIVLPIAGLDMPGLGRKIMLGGITLFIGYVLWEVLRTVIERHIAGIGPRRPGETAAQAQSRLVTIMPLLRIGLGIGLFTLTGLIVASELGIDTAPLIAGAGVFGLAVSFGSQSLVRDIVSGIFFIADDAFRVGEYVETSAHQRGTVEGMTIRSLRLRHQNGQLHTIPFGALGAVTNYSRDWTTVKFNLRLGRDTDLEVLRRTVKKLGQELTLDEEMAAQVIEPLKLQGIAEVADNALIVRLKFTALPANSSWVQRTYLRHLYERLPQNGIEFANAVVSVQAVGAPEPLLAPAAGAAALTLVPPAEPAPPGAVSVRA